MIITERKLNGALVVRAFVRHKLGTSSHIHTLSFFYHTKKSALKLYMEDLKRNGWVLA